MRKKFLSADAAGRIAAHQWLHRPAMFIYQVILFFVLQVFMDDTSSFDGSTRESYLDGQRSTSVEVDGAYHKLDGRSYANKM